MKKVLLLLPAVSVMELTSGVLHAQPQTEISIGGDLVSTYVWRGVYQSGFSLQPEIGLSVGGFTVGVWGSTDLDNFKEVDLSVGYSVRGGFGRSDRLLVGRATSRRWTVRALFQIR